MSTHFAAMAHVSDTGQKAVIFIACCWCRHRRLLFCISNFWQDAHNKNSNFAFSGKRRTGKEFPSMEINIGYTLATNISWGGVHFCHYLIRFGKWHDDGTRWEFSELKSMRKRNAYTHTHIQPNWYSYRIALCVSLFGVRSFARLFFFIFFAPKMAVEIFHFQYGWWWFFSPRCTCARLHNAFVLLYY